ncbi:MAG TPA: nickel pincer cofactor biosynthesis protein LarC [Spirochaetota bacterium]|nr:nickel pincer cofactor biosynthesis protein LarC [Spirochaetota bacterium]
MRSENILILDVELGASGDMLLGALIDLGLDTGALAKALAGLPVAGWRVSSEKTERHYFAGSRFIVECRDEAEERDLAGITAILNAAGLPGRAAERAVLVFETLAAAEASVHGVSPGEIHFHEVGALDSIIDIAGFCAALELLGVERIHYGDIPAGKGTVASRHGDIPLPSPAVSALVKGRSVVFTGRRGELITPTAAAILVALGSQEPAPPGVMLATGTGFGSREYPFLSCTRAFLAEPRGSGGEHLVQLECAIDDMNPQIYPWLMDLLLESGALDAYFVPAVMKKGRPGTLVTVIAEPGIAPRLKEILYRETSTIGIRELGVRREKLERRFEEVTVEGRTVRVKVSSHGGSVVNAQPEFEDCKKVAKETGLPLKVVLERAREEFARRG